MKILTVVGARPNIIKVAPLHRALLAHARIVPKIVHTGQHYDACMSSVFFRQLDLPEPDYHLGAGEPGSAGSATKTQQMATIMRRFEPVLLAEKPDWVVVVGDVTSTVACALAATNAGVRVAHVEAGLRSGDRRMPEEINRILTDKVSDLLFVTEQSGLDNLRREGFPDKAIHFVGNLMIDSLVQYRPQASVLNTVGTLGLTPKAYVLLTLHRPANVDNRASLCHLLQVVAETARWQTVLFPVHPRTRATLVRFGLLERLLALPNVRLLEPQGYLEFLNLMEYAAIVMTDSGGVQEETTYLQVPCLTLRDTTERPVTLEMGTNQLLADYHPESVRQHVAALLAGRIRPGRIPPLWDGQSAGRVAAVLLQSGGWAETGP